MEEVVEARFVKESKSPDGRQSYSIRFFNSSGDLSMLANFVKLYDSNGNLIKEKAAKFDEMYVKHGRREVLAIFADSVGVTFRPENGLQQESQGNTYKNSHYSTSPILQAMHKTVDQPYASQSQETRLKI